MPRQRGLARPLPVASQASQRPPASIDRVACRPQRAGHTLQHGSRQMRATVAERQTDEGGRSPRVHDRRALARPGRAGRCRPSAPSAHVVGQAIQVGVGILRLQPQPVAQPAQREPRGERRPELVPALRRRVAEGVDATRGIGQWLVGRDQDLTARAQGHRTVAGIDEPVGHRLGGLVGAPGRHRDAGTAGPARRRRPCRAVRPPRPTPAVVAGAARVRSRLAHSSEDQVRAAMSKSAVAEASLTSEATSPVERRRR